MCLEATIKLVGKLLKLFLFGLLLLQTALGIAMAIVGAIVFKEMAPEKPDTDEASKLETSLALFNYAQEVSRYTDTKIAKACLIMVCSGVALTGLGIIGLSSLVSGKPKFLLIFLAVLVASSTASTYVVTHVVKLELQAEEALADVMEWSLQTQYDGNFNSTNRWSKMWDLGHITFDCCGINNATDFRKSERFDQVYLGAEVGLREFNGSFVNPKIPVSCCKFNEDFSVEEIKAIIIDGNVPVDTKLSLKDGECIKDPTPENSNMKKGCKDELNKQVTRYSKLLTGLSSATFSSQVSLQLGIIVILYASFT